MASFLRARAERPAWTVEESAMFAARKEFELCKLLATDRAALRVAMRFGLLSHRSPNAKAWQGEGSWCEGPCSGCGACSEPCGGQGCAERATQPAETKVSDGCGRQTPSAMCWLPHKAQRASSSTGVCSPPVSGGGLSPYDCDSRGCVSCSRGCQPPPARGQEACLLLGWRRRATTLLVPSVVCFVLHFGLRGMC